jgi:hypothetical protein
MQDTHPVERCPDCDCPWAGLPPEGRCPECGFPYDPCTTVHQPSNTQLQLLICLAVIQAVLSALQCRMYLTGPSVGSGTGWRPALLFGCGAAFFAAFAIWGFLLSRQPWYVSFDGQGMRVRWGRHLRFAAWREIKRIDTFRWFSDIIVLAHGRRLRIWRSFKTDEYKQFIDKAKEELTRQHKSEADCET